MALQLLGNYETSSGYTIPSTYWRWVGLGIDVSAAKCTGVLYAYVSPEAFAAGKQPVGQRSYEIASEEFMALATQLETPGNPGLSSVIYSYIKGKDEFFASATDV